MLDLIIALLKKYIRTLTADALSAHKAGDNNRAVRISKWLENMQKALVRYHLAAYLAGDSEANTKAENATGIRNREIDPKVKAAIAKAVKAQFDFLDGFVAEIQEADEFIPGWLDRAESYANAIQIPYWQGRTKMLPLPAMPGQGTQCLGNCRCEWNVRKLASGANDYDCYWKLEAKAENCQTCTQRATEWSPLKIRAGRIVL